MRQLSYLSQFDCNVIHIAVKDNSVSDALSRVVINHVLHVDALPLSLGSIALEQRAASHLDAFNLSSDSVPVPNSNLSILTDTSMATDRILIPSSLSEPSYPTIMICII